MSTLAAYEATLSATSRLKLRATALLASGNAEEEFEACVLLHEAARLEVRAASALVGAPAETRLAGLVEACGCLLDGRDPVGAARVWAELVEERANVAPEVASAMLARLTPRFEQNLKAYQRAIARSTMVRRALDAQRLALESSAARARWRTEITKLTGQYPGDAQLYWVAHRVADASGQAKQAWHAIGRARRLDPEHPRYEAFALLAAVHALSRDEAEAHLAAVRLSTAAPEVCLMYALAQLTLARGASAQRERWARARDAARQGLGRTPAEVVRKNLRAVELLATALLEQQAPGPALLYSAGLSDVAARSRPDEDMLELLTRNVRAAA